MIEPILTERLRLLSMSAEFIEALRDRDAARGGTLLGIKPPDAYFLEPHHWMEMRIRQMQEDPGAREWLMRAMVTADDEMVGHCGFHGRPDERGMCEIGYSVHPERRRRGYAIESVRGQIAWAFARPEITVVRASVSPDNAPSLALIAQLGFARAGEQMDEIDGLEYVYELSRDAQAD